MNTIGLVVLASFVVGLAIAWSEGWIVLFCIQYLLTVIVGMSVLAFAQAGEGVHSTIFVGLGFLLITGPLFLGLVLGGVARRRWKKGKGKRRAGK
jgi:hypothetical protein